MSQKDLSLFARKEEFLSSGKEISYENMILHTRHADMMNPHDYFWLHVNREKWNFEFFLRILSVFKAMAIGQNR